MYDEPEIDPLEDTRPTVTVPAVTPGTGRRRLVGLITLLAAFGLTLGAVLLLLTPPDSAPTPQISEVTGVATRDSPMPTATPTVTPPDADDETDSETGLPDVIAGMDDTLPEAEDSAFALPTLSAEQRALYLQTPVAPLNDPNTLRIARSILDPFTTIPDRPRNEVIDYEIQPGDTVSDIALRFGLEPESIAWSNDRTALWTLVPGTVLKIPPADGVVHIAVGEATIADIVARYKVDDPLLVIDSEYNALRGLSPEAIPPSGLAIFIPGGEAEAVDWSPPALEGGGIGTDPNGDANTVQFEPGAPGSCGAVARGAGTAWGQPMARGTYTVTRGFSAWHQGIDLAAPVGTPVYAANGGNVVFAGRSYWGYGLAVVISHGPFTTLYGHLSQVNVSCGQTVGTGQVIGLVGSTGNSSGPHLHFEILSGNTRTNPASTLAF